ncbi:transposase, partial [Candidatus Wolfebacteria bacterium]|nr:transposase [Candidatus Wolfebacteria bacterium]
MSTAKLKALTIQISTTKKLFYNERFNRTIQEEFVDLGNFTPEIPKFNEKLAGWLIEYNFKRPHQVLGYQTPIAV